MKFECGDLDRAFVNPDLMTEARDTSGIARLAATSTGSGKKFQPQPNSYITHGIAQTFGFESGGALARTSVTKAPLDTMAGVDARCCCCCVCRSAWRFVLAATDQFQGGAGEQESAGDRFRKGFPD